MLSDILQNRYAVTAVILFGVGFTNLMLQQNLLRKVIGFNIMDSAIFLLLASLGYIDGGVAPIVGGPGIRPPLHQPYPQRPGADGHRGVRVHHRLFSGADPADLSSVRHH